MNSTSLENYENFGKTLDEFRQLRALLLLAKAALFHRSADADFLAIPSDSFNESFLDLSDRHRLTPVIYDVAAHAPEGAISKTTLDALRSRVLANRLKAIRMTTQTAHLSRILEQAGVRCIPLKGACLAMSLYGDPAKRHAGDIDLLVSPDQIVKADGVLSASGYSRCAPGHDMSEMQWKKAIRLWNHFIYADGDGDNLLELHWRPLYLRGMIRQNFDDLYNRGRDFQIGKTRVRILSESDNFRFLCAHGARHAWFRLFWLFDIAKIISEDSRSAWRFAIENETEPTVKRSMLQAVILSRILFGTPAQGDMAADHDRRIGWLVKSAFNTIVEPWPPSLLQTIRQRIFYNLRLAEGSGFHLDSIEKVFLHPSDWEEVKLSDRWFFLYYLIGPFLWLNRNRSRNPEGIKQ